MTSVEITLDASSLTSRPVLLKLGAATPYTALKLKSARREMYWKKVILFIHSNVKEAHNKNDKLCLQVNQCTFSPSVLFRQQILCFLATTKNLNQDSRSLHRHLNPGPPEYEIPRLSL
jgi:hypothetical protein